MVRRTLDDVFKKLKQMGQALSPDAIRQGLAASREAMASGGRLSPEQLAGLPPEQREAYEQAMAQVQVNADRAIDEALSRRVLRGPAGDHLYGPLPDREQITSVDIGQQLAQARDGFRQALRETVGRSPAPPTPTPVSADPAVQAAHELAQREEARTAYLAPDRSPVAFARIATDRKRSVEELAAWLGSSGLAGRPDLVYGVARVPDHVPGSFGINRAAIVEWEVVHAVAPGQPTLPPAAPPEVAAFDARETWAARAPGEPSVLDEDVALAYLREADLGPEQCLGIARRVEVDATGGGGEDSADSARVTVGVTGVLALHPAGLGAGALDRMRAARPLQVLPAPDVHVEVLNWSPVRRVVMPRTDRRPLLPSPFPYLPSTAGELLHSYLAIVGVRPQDCYSAQVTQDQPSNIIGGTAHVTTTGAEKEVAADGEVRKRFRGGSRVVIAYRDAPAYATGRERWAAYQREVLQADLSLGLDLRSPVPRQSALDRGGLGRLVRGTEAIGDFVTGEGIDRTIFADVPDHRYCWPPVQ